MSRPTKLTPSVHDAIVKSARSGVSIETAAEAAGVSANTVWAWLRRAEDEADSGSPFVEFRYALKKARAEWEMETVGVVTAAAPQSWQAAAWLLERSFPKRWGRRTVIETDEPDAANRPITLKGLADLMNANTDTDD